MNETPELVVLRGLPGSGKSRYAHQETFFDTTGRTVVLSRDGLRDMLRAGAHEGVLSSQEEHLITETLRRMATRLLKEGRKVIVDATNLRAKDITGWARIAHARAAGVRVVDFTAVPLDKVLERNAKRLKPAPSQVIVDKYQRFIAGKNQEKIVDDALERGLTTTDRGVEPAPERDPKLPDAYIFDLDGTLAQKYEARDIYDASLAHLDTPIEDVQDILYRLAQFEDPAPHLIFCTGRHVEHRQQTKDWLLAHTPYDPHTGDLLLMRQEKSTPDWKVKLDLYNEHIRGQYNVLGVFDDRNQVVELWRELGLTCFQVAPGDF